MPKKKEKYCFFNGKIKNEKDAKVNPYDIGILRGYGVFDVMSTYNGKPFLVKEHWKRLKDSAKELSLKVPISFSEFEDTIKKLLQKNGYKDSLVRTVLTGGVGKDGYLPGKENFYILVTKFQKLPREVYDEGAKVITLEYIRTLPEAKTTNYIVPIKNNSNKVKAGAVEIVYVYEGNVLEASTSNIFIIKNKKLITPDKGMLRSGTTKGLVEKLVKRSKIEIEEREVSLDEFVYADEAFLTATNKDIVPIVDVDGKKIGSGKVGEMTRFLMEKFQEYKKKY